MDFPRAWEIAKSVPIKKHHKDCSHRLTGGALLCDCAVITDHPEYKQERLMKILALDFGTKTGWAIGTPGNEISGTENFKNRASDSRGMVFVKFDRWINEMLSEHKPALVVHERPHLRGRAASEVLNGMLGFTVKACRTHGVQYTDCPSRTLKKFATGKGNASKEKMVEAYREKWKKDPVDDNEADARWLLEWGHCEFSKEDI